MTRVHGRITKDDIKAATLRRWDGRGRVTTDWINLYHEPELCFPNGDCLVYLREPGQSSRGPSFRIHSSQLIVKGFRALVDRAAPRPVLHPLGSCNVPACEGCDSTALKELFLPAPPKSDIDTRIDHHLDTRNFFAWLYDMPLAGRALGTSLVGLKRRLDIYRPGKGKNQLDLVSFLERQRYLDFRECVDHALAVLHFAEIFEVEDLWVDAFAHCVGLSHAGMPASLEYVAISKATKGLIIRARMEMDIRLDRVGRSVMNFFENDLSPSFLGLPPASREHFDRFRSFLHAYYIEQYGFWPPDNYDNDNVRQSIYATMYSDFRNLYLHLVDTKSSPSMASMTATGGVCALQNIQAFDQRHHYEPLPHPLPMGPTVPNVEQSSSRSKRRSLNPLRNRQAEREMRIELEMQALVDSSNRDWNVMRCLLVRRFSDFEQQSVFDDFDHVSLVDGRKARWILIYAVLQTLISVMQAPRQVRNTEGLSYSLCCHPPKVMPWKLESQGPPRTAISTTNKEQGKPELEPDTNYLRPNLSSTSLKSIGERRHSLPTKSSTTSSGKASPTGSRPSSLRRILTRRSLTGSEKATTTKRPAFCEILVQGYGNGLNEVKLETPAPSTSEDGKSSSEESDKSKETEKPSTPPASTAGVSRESSKSSGYSGRSSEIDEDSSTSADTSDSEQLSFEGIETISHNAKGDAKIMDERNNVGEIHFNTETWDRILSF